MTDVPLNYNFNSVASDLRVPNPSKVQTVAAFESLGYKVSQTYYNAKLWKTNAPPEVIYDIFKQYKLNMHQGDMEKYYGTISKNSPSYRILEKKVEHKPSFNVAEKKREDQKE